MQDFYVKYGLNATEGVSEVASVGGFVKEYQVDVDPAALRAYNIQLHQVMMAVQKSNRDVGAKTIEINQAEYLVRGLGYIKSVEDIEKAVVDAHDNVPVRISDIAVVVLGPATRRGVLDKDGAEVVGGVVVALSGIAIAIGTMVDLGVILSENIIKHLDEAPPGSKTGRSVNGSTTSSCPCPSSCLSSDTPGPEWCCSHWESPVPSSRFQKGHGGPRTRRAHTLWEVPGFRTVRYAELLVSA